MESKPPVIRQRIALVLLLVCIGVCSVLLIEPELLVKPELTSLDELDAIINDELIEFNIKQSQIQLRTVDEQLGFGRQIYRVEVPENFSKTFFHSELSRRLYPFEVRTPSMVDLPSQDLNIHVYWRNTIVRTLELRSSSDLSRNMNPGIIILETSVAPTQQLLERIEQIGEPIRIVYRSDNTDVLLGWLQETPRTMKPPLIHLDYDSGVAGLTDERFDRFISDVSRMVKQSSNTSLILIEQGGFIASARLQRLLRTGVHVTRIQDPIYLSGDTDRESFNEMLQTFVRETRAGKRPVFVVPAIMTYIEWLQEDLIRYKKGGLHLTEPEFIL